MGKNHFRGKKYYNFYPEINNKVRKEKTFTELERKLKRNKRTFKIQFYTKNLFWQKLIQTEEISHIYTLKLIVMKFIVR